MSEHNDNNQVGKNDIQNELIEKMTVANRINTKKDETWMEKFFNADGRLNRKPFIIRWLILSVIALCLDLLAPMAGMDFTVRSFISAVEFIFISVPSIMLMIRRLHDLNRSGWWWLLLIVPFINLALIIYILFFKGTVGPNRFGEDPLS